MTSNNNIETEYKELNGNNAWPVIYQHIRNESSKFDFKCLEALKPQNKNLNRYRDVSPFDHSRIVLKKGPCDYINANLIKVERANRRYILTQGPLAYTVGHFWLMVWEQKSKAVIMLNKLVEKKQVKCHWYWPQEIGPDHTMSLEEVGLTVEYMEHHDHSYYSSRILRLTDISSKESRDILQFHYTTWPDFGVPTSPTAFLDFLRKVRHSGALEETVGPVIVHCSAGIGRSGTFCLVDTCLILIEKFGLNSVDVKEVLLEMRRYRMGLIQTPDQLRFSYQAIIEGAKRLSQSSSDTEIENCNSEENLTRSISSDSIEEEEVPVHSSEEDEPPPLPPPRLDSLQPRNAHVDRPLPNIPNSTSLNDFNTSYNEGGDISGGTAPSRPLPGVPGSDDEPALEEEEDVDDDDDTLDDDKSVTGTNDINNMVSPAAELRHRKRQERKELMSEKVKDMKRRQRSVEKWQQLKRSLYKPIVIAGAIAISGGCLFAYIYYYRA